MSIHLYPASGFVTHTPTGLALSPLATWLLFACIGVLSVVIVRLSNAWDSRKSAPVVESVRITQACPECSIVSPLEVLTPNLPNINSHALDLLCDECGCITPLAVTDWETVEPVAVEVVEPMSAYCEDYPCCGHTDGLGCNWVSPNEVQPCQDCINARANSPYHTAWAGDCPTTREQAEKWETAERLDPRVYRAQEYQCYGCSDGYVNVPSSLRKREDLRLHSSSGEVICQDCWTDYISEAEVYSRFGGYDEYGFLDN